MRKILLFILIMFLAIPCYAGYNVCYDGDGLNLNVAGSNPINGCLYFYDGDMDEYNRVKALYQTVGLKYMKVVNDIVEEMSQAEKDTIIQAEADAKEQAILDAIDKYEVSNLELLTALVQRINARIPANPITRAEIIQQLKDNR